MPQRKSGRHPSPDGGVPVTGDGAVTVAVSTIASRLPRIELPPPAPGLRYLLLVQAGEGAQAGALPPELDGRADLAMVAIAGRGLSNSRNRALDLSTDPFLVFSDDDLALSPEGIALLRDALLMDPSLDLVAGWRSELLPVAGRRARPHRLNLFNAGRICAPELMVRRASIVARGLRFDPDFGLGARHGVGEEYAFVTDALKAGCKGLSLPVVTGAHPHPSTGDDWHDPGLLRARVALLKRVFGRWSPPVRAAYALRHRRRFPTFRAGMHFVLGYPSGRGPDSAESSLAHGRREDED